MLKRVIPSAGLAVLPNTGHALSVEEPDAYNALLDAFLAQVETGRWPLRDPRSASATITGIEGRPDRAGSAGTERTAPAGS